MSALDLRPARPLLVGVVHLAPTPGAPRFDGDLAAALERARADARALAEGGADAVLVENFGDAPFHPGRVPPETVAAMARAVDAVRGEVGALPVGVNVLRNDARAALGICASTGASFLRVNVLVGAMVTDQGLIQGSAAELLRERARLAPGVLLLADVHVKHATPLAGGDLVDAALDTLQRGLADALVLSGSRTGRAPDPASLARVREAVGEAPLLVGSGLDERNAALLVPPADGGIVATSLQAGGRPRAPGAPIERERVRRLRDALDRAR